MFADIGRSRATDYFHIADQLTREETNYLIRTRQFVDDEVLPVINDYWERAEFPWPLIKRMADLGIVGDGIEGYGCPPMSPMACGLIHMELNRGDGSLGTFLGVQAGLAMKSIAMLGSEEQKQRWLPEMAALEARRVRAHRADARLGLGRAGDLRPPRRRSVGDRREQEVDRQRHDRRRRRGVGARRRRRPGQGIPGGEGHAGLYGASHRRQGVAAGGVAGRDHPDRDAGQRREPAARREQLQGRRPRAGRHAQRRRLGRAGPRHRRLRDRRCRYCTERQQFGKPLVSFQIVQDKLVKMLAEVCSMQLYCLRLGRLIEEGKLTDTIAALAKMNNTRKARQVILEARDLLGGNGILLDFHVMRHMADIEALHTYEGTETIQTLIVGRDITGVGAFA